MPIEIKMPALSPTMEEGTLAKWLVKAGDPVKPGDILAEIETDKATMEFETVEEGVIASIAVAEGTDGVKVGTVIATLSEGGKVAAQGETPASVIALAKMPVPTPAPPTEQQAKDHRPPAHPENAPGAPAPSSMPMFADDGGRASPLARRLASAQGIDLSDRDGVGAGWADPACGRAGC